VVEIRDVVAGGGDGDCVRRASSRGSLGNYYLLVGTGRLELVTPCRLNIYLNLR